MVLCLVGGILVVVFFFICGLEIVLVVSLVSLMVGGLVVIWMMLIYGGIVVFVVEDVRIGVWVGLNNVVFDF